MAAFAEQHDVCFILVAHPNKNEDASAVNRLSGAKALTSVFRNTWLVEKDPEKKDERMMLSVKGNLAGEFAKGGLRFKVNNVEDTGIQAEDGITIRDIGKLAWLGATDKDADEVLAAAAGGGKGYARKKKKQDCTDLLKEYLRGGAGVTKTFYDKAALLDFTEWIVKDAARALKVKNRRINGTYYWALSEVDLDAEQIRQDRARLVIFGADPAGGIAK
jgi:hypothetical protein